MADKPAIIEFRNITKRFPGVLAVNNVSLKITEGSCHALVGENGAGKSTLGKMLAGIHQPDEGEIYILGEKVEITNPIDALHAGIGMVYQELCFCENMTVAENLCLGNMPNKFSFISYRNMRKIARERLASIELDIDVNTKIQSLPIGVRQMIQIASAVGRGARILIFDEPTSSLSEIESRNLFKLIKYLQQRGVTSIYVSHRMEEIFEICDKITVMRDGSHIATVNTTEVNEESLVEMMIGRKIENFIIKDKPLIKGDETLNIKKFSSRGKFSDISFKLHKGEILGFAGLVGSGRTEVFEALFGLDKNASGNVFLNGNKISIKSPAAAMSYGIGLVPEDRKRNGLVLMMSSKTNISMPSLKKLSRLTWIKSSEEDAVAKEYFDIMKVKSTGINAITESLSGGNQQKIVIAKWLASKCNILILDEPTRGVDVGAKSEISNLIYNLAASGNSIILISSDLPEIISLSTRVLVMRNGQIVGELEGEDINQHKILKYMTGIETAEKAAV